MFKHTTTFRLWVTSILLFWVITLFITFIDYIGDKWFDIEWARGADMFPNMILGYPLFIIQLLSSLILIASGVKIYSVNKQWQGIILGVISVLTTATVCFLVYAIFAYWYHADFMGRSI
ncbi:hypothetical protein [uncultured Cocleimonas sp.]|uniref:hypothetical protein n=1 Tax=uncultured Cocleimonas sp. TaxID=1051587 RepID=UPI00262B0CE2|nr:hypothetical protein [uncultured Cocleimonas sp.]